MSDAELMFNKYTLRESARIQKICEPLHRYLDVNYFWYSHTTADGGFFSIGSKPDMHEYYFTTKLFVHSPFFHNPSLIQPGFYSYRSIQDPKFQQTLDLCVDATNVNLGMSLVMKQGGELLRFGYASDRTKGAEFSDRIINNLPLLKKFNQHFLSEMKPTLKSVHNDLVNLPIELGSAYNKPPKGLQKKTTCHDKSLFLDSLGLIEHTNISQLTRREMQCMQYLAKGFNSRDIADELELSKRTVQFYIGNIMLKLNCDNRLELIRIADLLNLCGYFEM